MLNECDFKSNNMNKKSCCEPVGLDQCQQCDLIHEWSISDMVHGVFILRHEIPAVAGIQVTKCVNFSAYNVPIPIFYNTYILQCDN